MKFSANLGFLWTELELPQAVMAAKDAGFDAVECHWPYDCPWQDVAAALSASGLPMLGLNTRVGNRSFGEMGLAAVPGREDEARAHILEGIDYGHSIGALNVHVMAGVTEAEGAQETYLGNLRFACDEAARHGMTILIEPLNSFDAPGYFLSLTTQASHIIEKAERENLKLMFDCYHVQRMEGHLHHKLEQLHPIIGHIQFASVPGRAEPAHGEINYDYIFAQIDKEDYAAYAGAEYKPDGPTEASLDWLNNWKRGRSVSHLHEP